MIYELCTDRLLLRQWKDSDFEAFAAITSNLEVMQYFPKLLNRDETYAWIDQVKYLLDVKGWGLWAIELVETQEFIGCVGLHSQVDKFEFSPCVEIGWRLDPKFWGKGYATEGAQACLKFAFEVLDLPEVVAFTVDHNLASKNVIQKLSMTYSHDFLYPDLDDSHPLKIQKLYKIQKQEIQL